MEYVESQEFKDLDFNLEGLLTGEYEFCTFEQCNFSNFNLEHFKFIECNFVDCNLSNCIIQDTAFHDVTFKQCKMLGLQFDTCNPFNFGITVENSDLSHSSFYQMRLIRSNFIGSKMESVDFTEANLSGRKLTDCDLLNASFERTNIEQTDLRSSLHFNIDPEINYIKKAKFSQNAVMGLLKKYQIIVE